MAVETWVYDGSTSPGGWKQLVDIWVYDGSTSPGGWKQLHELWVCDGATNWEQIYQQAIDPATLDSVTISTDCVACGGCGASKCDRCVGWSHTGGINAKHHIRILRSVGGGSYFEIVDDLSVNATCGGCGATCSGDGCYCGHLCGNDNATTQFKVRLEVDGTDTLVGDSVERTTSTVQTCVVE